MLLCGYVIDGPTIEPNDNVKHGWHEGYVLVPSTI